MKFYQWNLFIFVAGYQNLLNIAAILYSENNFDRELTSFRTFSGKLGALGETNGLKKLFAILFARTGNDMKRNSLIMNIYILFH